MKRNLTLTGFILGLVPLAILTVFLFIGFCELISYLGFVEVTLLILVIELVLITTTVLNACSISTFNKTPEKYKKKKALIITTVVFNFVVAIFSFIMLFYSTTGFVLFLYILTFACLIATNVLVIVDLARENKKVKEYNGKTDDPEVKIQSNKTETTETKANNDLESQLEKIAVMKAKGILTEEEYQELRKSYIQKQINS